MVRLVGGLARMDAGRLRLHRVPPDHGADRQGVRRAADRGGVRADDHLVDAPGRRRRRGLARRPDRAQDAADDFDRMVFAEQFHRRFLSDPVVSAAVPRVARDRHGGGMAGRRGTGDGELAAALARLDERHPPVVGQPRLYAVERHLRPVLRLSRLARHAVDRHPARPVDHLYPLFCQRAAGLGREPPAAARRGARSAHAAVCHLQAGVLGNTLGACWFMASGFICWYSINSLFAAHLDRDLHMSPALLATPIALANLLAFISATFWGYLSDRIGRRWAMISPALLAIPLAPIYLFTDNFWIMVVAFVAQGFAGTGGMFGQVPSYLNERFPTEVR